MAMSVPITDLPVLAMGTAQEAIKKTEISLVIDIAAPMRFKGKIDTLSIAKKQFIVAVLNGNAADTKSLNIIPFGG